VTAVIVPPTLPRPAAPPVPPTKTATAVAPARPGWLAPVVRFWPLALALMALGIYVAAGCFMLFSVHYEIGDALSRSEDAREVLFSRDPHLAAWGFVWFPLPVVLQLPFMAVMSPLNQAALSGPLSTAACGAVTVLVLVKLFRRLGLSEPVVAGLTITYCLNPVIIFYCGNGMSEASFYLAASVFLLGIVAWFQEGGSLSLILVSMGLAASMAIREEALALVPLVAALVAFRERSWARRAKVATLVALPGVFVFGLWTFANWLIMGNPLFWYDGLSTEATPPGSASWLPAHKSLATGVVYAARYTWAFVPALVIVLPLLFLIVLRHRRRLWALVSVVGAAAVFPGQVAATMSENKSWGDPRYFASLTVFATVILALAAREATAMRWGGAPARRVICLSLVCLAALNAASGTLNDLNPRTTPVEDESRAFRAAFGLPQAKIVYAAVPIVEWHGFDSYIDPYLSKGQLIMVDTSTAFPAPLFSRYPGGWIVPSNRDYQALSENFSGQFQWLLQSPTAADAQTAEINQALGSTDGGRWSKVKYFGPTVGELYRWVPNRPL
jgi:hypothetical protein